MSSFLSKVRAKKSQDLVTVDILGETLGVVPLSVSDRMKVMQECVSISKTSVSDDLKSQKFTRSEAEFELTKFIALYGFGEDITPSQIEQMYQIKVESEYDLQLIKSAVFNFGKIQAVEVLRTIEDGRPSGKMFSNQEERSELLDFFGSNTEELQIVTNALSEKKAPSKPKRKSTRKSST